MFLLFHFSNRGETAFFTLNLQIPVLLFKGGNCDFVVSKITSKTIFFSIPYSSLVPDKCSALSLADSSPPATNPLLLCMSVFHSPRDHVWFLLFPVGWRAFLRSAIFTTSGSPTSTRKTADSLLSALFPPWVPCMRATWAWFSRYVSGPVGQLCSLSPCVQMTHFSL